MSRHASRVRRLRPSLLRLLQASLGEDKEYGLKFDFFEGRVSGTISKFEIHRRRW